jgi:small subunit ribosomal protein S5
MNNPHLNISKEFEERAVQINRISKKTKGGNKMRFAVLMVVGDKRGRVGTALSKATDVASAMRKSAAAAQRRLITVPMKGNTIPHSIRYSTGAAEILIKPAPVGTGVIAGGAMRAVLELAGIKDVVAKIIGTRNKVANVNATILALSKLKNI